MARRLSPRDPQQRRNRVAEALSVLKDIGMPREQQNERSALTLLALLDLKPGTPWSEATNPLRGITPMMDFFRKHYGKRYAPNTRETVRRFTVHQFLQAGLVEANPDEPARPVNSPKAVYQIEDSLLKLFRAFGSRAWQKQLRQYLSNVEPLKKRYAHEREMPLVPVHLSAGQQIELTPGAHNELIRKVVEEFCPRFTPGGRLVYVGDTGGKLAYLDKPVLEALGFAVDEHGKMPDAIVHIEHKNWLVLIEAVTSHGPVNAKRHLELKKLFVDCKAALVFVTAFARRKDMVKYLSDIAWETEVWVAEAPSHLIHFNGERFLGPYPV